MSNFSPEEFDYPLTPDSLFQVLDKLGIKTTTVSHRAVFSVPEGADIKAKIPGAHSKNLFVKDKKGRFFLITAKDHTPINLKKAHEVIGANGRLSFCTAEQLMEHLGVLPGSVTPLAIANDRAKKVHMILDSKLMEHDLVNCHPLINTMTTTLARKDLLHFLRAVGHEAKIVVLPPPPSTTPQSENSDDN